MYSNYYEPLVCTGKYRVLITGSFAPQGTGQPTQPIGEKAYVAITRSNVGIFLFTFADKHDRLGSAWFQVQANAAAEYDQVITGAVDLAGNRTLTVTSLTAGSAADIAANPNNRIYYGFVVADAPLGVGP